MSKRFYKHVSNAPTATEKSEPGSHARLMHGHNSKENWSLKILANCRSDWERKVIESEKIELLKPTLNKRRRIAYVRLVN